MFYFLSKAIDFLVMPLSVVLFMLIYALDTKSAKRRKWAIVFSLALLLFVSNGFIINKAFNWWEPSPRNVDDIQNEYDVGILLSGGLIAANDPNEDHAALGNHGDRVLQTFLLYKSGKIKTILISGISAKPLMKVGKGESRQASALLVKWGVPAEDIIFEEKARNTRENAVFSAKILRERFPNGRYLLITSAFHMRRSVGCFKKVGIQTDTFPADYYGNYYAMDVKDGLVPDSDAIAYFSILWHEWIGYLVYKTVGYA